MSSMTAVATSRFQVPANLLQLKDFIRDCGSGMPKLGVGWIARSMRQLPLNLALGHC